MYYETYEKPDGFCPHCGMAYGKIYRKDTDEPVNEYSNCVCWMEEEQVRKSNRKNSRHMIKYKQRLEK